MQKSPTNSHVNENEQIQKEVKIDKETKFSYESIPQHAIKQENNDFPQITNTTQKKKGFFQDEKMIRIALIVLTCLLSSAFGGAFYGYGPMLLMLEDSGAFSSLCHNHEKEEDHVSQMEPCKEQASHLLNVHLTATTLVLFTAPLFGALLDRLGIVKFFCIITLSELMGLSLLTISVATGIDILLYPAFALFGVLSSAIGVVIVETGMLFNGRFRANLISSLNSLYDAGPLTFLGIWAIQQATGLSLAVLCAIYLSCATICLVSTTTLWTIVVPVSINPKRYQNIAEENDEESNLLDMADVPPPYPPPKFERGREKLSSSSKQLRAEPFLLLLLFYSINNAKANMLLSTASSFLSSLGDDKTGHKYLAMFTFLTPTSIFGVPLLDFVIQNYGFEGGFQMTNLLSLAHGLVQTSSDLNIQVIGFFIYPFYRCFLYSSVFGFLPYLLDQCVRGKGIGLLSLASGVVSFANIPLMFVTMRYFHGNFIVPNAAYGLLSVLCIFLARRLGIYAHQKEIGASASEEGKNSFERENKKECLLEVVNESILDVTIVMEAKKALDMGLPTQEILTKEDSKLLNAQIAAELKYDT